ncbi:mucolipin [Anaeramoeba flamelloides]|uniref:Mucolipin n=1 Tax=Anaeramoeba flamelloides TaxID=1746091 RepID=A0AAV7ZYL1_9EUKA|nr:mucolipin [Anaeramoeba flamelloides]
MSISDCYGKLSCLENNFCFGLQRKRIPEHKLLTISPYQKLITYHRIPWKFLLILLLVILITAQTIEYESLYSPYYSANEDLFAQIFLPGTKTYIETSNGLIQKYIYSVQELKDSIDNVVVNYYNFSRSSIGFYEFQYETDQTPTPPKFKVESYKNVKFDQPNPIDPSNYEIETITYDLTISKPLGPFSGDLDQSLDFMKKFKKGEITFYFKNLFPTEIPKCLLWKIVITYDYQIRGGSTRASILSDATDCQKVISSSSHYKSSYFLISLVLLISAIWLMGLSSHSLYNEYRLYKNTYQRVLGQKSLRLDSEHFASQRSFRMAFFNFWYLWNIPTCISVIIAELIYMFTHFSTAKINNLLFSITLGIAAFCCWFSLTGYFQWYQSFYSLINVISRALPKVIRFTLCALPIFLGYAYLGTIAFGSYVEYFSTIDQTCVTLFAVLNGDICRDTYDLIYRQNHGMAVLSRIYMYTFICLFIYAWVNVFITVGEEAYISIIKDPKPVNLKGKRQLKQYIKKSKDAPMRSDSILKSKETISRFFSREKSSFFWGDDQEKKTTSDVYLSQRYSRSYSVNNPSHLTPSANEITPLLKPPKGSAPIRTPLGPKKD